MRARDLLVLAAGLALWSGAALAEAPERSLRPLPRDRTVPAEDVAVVEVAVPAVAGRGLATGTMAGGAGAWASARATVEWPNIVAGAEESDPVTRSADPAALAAEPVEQSIAAHKANLAALFPAEGVARSLEVAAPVADPETTTGVLPILPDGGLVGDILGGGGEAGKVLGAADRPQELARVKGAGSERANAAAPAETLADAGAKLAETASTMGSAVRPRMREDAAAPVSAPRAEALMLRPRPRPAALVRAVNPAARSVEVIQASSRLAVVRSLRPAARPENLRRRAVVRAAAMIPTRPDPGGITGRKGGLCGDPAIRGETIAPIAGRLGGCGVEAPVRVTEVDGVRLSTPATIDCATARALRHWVSETVKPNVGRLGGGVTGLEVFAHYACRTRNNQRGAKISEHGRGRAIDIGAIVLKNGAAISVLDHWRDDDLGQVLKAMHRGACGQFGTVLGPAADRFHQNHFHLDTSPRRSGAFCR